jgi:hypothetical protein
MTQMTQRLRASMARMAMLLGHLGYQKTMTQMTQSLPAGMHGHAI